MLHVWIIVLLINNGKHNRTIVTHAMIFTYTQAKRIRKQNKNTWVQ